MSLCFIILPQETDKLLLHYTNVLLLLEYASIPHYADIYLRRIRILSLQTDTVWLQ